MNMQDGCSYCSYFHSLYIFVVCQRMCLSLIIKLKIMSRYIWRRFLGIKFDENYMLAEMRSCEIELVNYSLVTCPHLMKLQQTVLRKDCICKSHSL